MADKALTALPSLPVFVITKVLRDQWKAYWEARPQELPESLNELLDELEPLPEGSVDTDRKHRSTIYYGHADYPNAAFPVAVRGDEVIMLGLAYRRKKEKAPRQLGKPEASEVTKAEVPPPAEPLPFELAIPAGLTAMGACEWIKSCGVKLNDYERRNGASPAAAARAWLSEQRIVYRSRLVEESNAAQTEKRTNDQRSRDREFGQIRNMIAAYLREVKDETAKMHVGNILDMLNTLQHREG